MFVIEQRIVVNRSLEEVFSFMTEPGNLFQWSRSLLEVTQLTKGPIAVGSRFELVSMFLGRRIPTVLEVVEYLPNDRVVSRSLGGSFDLIGETTYEHSEEGTVVHSKSTIQPKGGWKLLEPILPSLIRSRSAIESELLRETLERKLRKDDSEARVLLVESHVSAVS